MTKSEYVERIRYFRNLNDNEEMLKKFVKNKTYLIASRINNAKIHINEEYQSEDYGYCIFVSKNNVVCGNVVIDRYEINPILYYSKNGDNNRLCVYLPTEQYDFVRVDNNYLNLNSEYFEIVSAYSVLRFYHNGVVCYLIDTITDEIQLIRYIENKYKFGRREVYELMQKHIGGIK